jgi:hypothetical protein
MSIVSIQHTARHKYYRPGIALKPNEFKALWRMPFCHNINRDRINDKVKNSSAGLNNISSAILVAC